MDVFTLPSVLLVSRLNFNDRKTENKRMEFREIVEEDFNYTYFSHDVLSIKAF